MVTAFIAVLIVVVHFVAVFSPRAYPFRNVDGSDDGNDEAKFRPNPVDQYALCLTERLFPRKYDYNGSQSRLETVLTKVSICHHARDLHNSVEEYSRSVF